MGVSVASASVLSLALGAFLTVALWRLAARYRLAITGRTCSVVTSTRGTGDFRWDEITGTGTKSSLTGRAHYVLVNGGIVLQSRKGAVTQRGIVFFDAGLAAASAAVRAHMAHVLAPSTTDTAPADR